MVVLKKAFSKWRITLQDNARPQTAKLTMDALTEIGGSPLEHPPYSPDFAPCDFWAFPTMKIQNHWFHCPPEACSKRSAASFLEGGGAL
jgi:transposase